MENKYVEEADTFERCMEFLHGIGIRTLFREIKTGSFLPGFLIDNGIINIDKSRIQNPGDLLHEAGHIAVVRAADRAALTEDVIIQRKDRELEEVMAIAWSYAACIYLTIDPHFVFHAQGYRNGSDYITESCDDGSYFGLQMLQGIGMMVSKKKGDQEPSYPDMIKWLRE